MLFRLISVLISLRPCRNPNLFSSFSSFRSCSRSIYSIQESQTTLAFSRATATTAFLPSASSTSSRRVSPASQILCMPKRPVSLTSPWRMTQKWEQGSSIWQRTLLASFCLTRPIRSRHTPITRWIFRKKGLNSYSAFIVFSNRSFVLPPFFRSRIISLNFYMCSLQLDASEFYLVALDYFYVYAFVLVFSRTDLYRFGSEKGMANSGTPVNGSLTSFYRYSLMTSLSVEATLLYYYFSFLLSRLLYRSWVMCGVSALLGRVAGVLTLRGSRVEVILAASSLFFRRAGFLQKECSAMLPLASDSSSAGPLRSRWLPSVSQRAYLRLYDWSEGYCFSSYDWYSSRLRLSTESIYRIEGSCRACFKVGTGGRISLPPPYYSLQIIIILLPAGIVTVEDSDECRGRWQRSWRVGNQCIDH